MRLDCIVKSATTMLRHSHTYSEDRYKFNTRKNILWTHCVSVFFVKFIDKSESFICLQRICELNLFQFFIASKIQEVCAFICK